MAHGTELTTDDLPPATVTVLAGQTSATFNLTLTNDALLNGARNVMVTPSEPAGYVFVPGTVEVRDDEIGTLTMTAPASVTPVNITTLPVNKSAW